MIRRVVVVALTLGALLAGAAAAGAHPLGNFTVNTYLRAEASGAELYLRQVVDMAEIPALRERSAVEDAGGPEAYARRVAATRAREIRVTLDGAPVAVEPVSWTAAWRPGAGGLQVLRYAAWYRVAAPAGDGARALRIVPTSYAGRLGWHEIVVRASSGARVEGATVADEDRSDELSAYPDDLLSSPLVQREAAFTWTPGAGAGAVGPLTADPESRVDAEEHGGLDGLVSGDLSLGVILGGLLLAMGWGALHSLSPGHGKAMVAAYLVGTRGTARHAFILGVFVTITHTIGVVGLGLVTLLASRYILPEALFPWINLVAALAVVGVGAWVGWSRLRSMRAARAHERAHATAATRARGPRPPALARTGARPALVAHRHDHGHHHHHGHHHDHHGPGGHTHAPPADLSMRSLMAVGATAGLIPCPSALVLLLGAIALDRVAWGLVLVLSFSIGLAGLLSVIGLLVLYARRLVDRLPLDGRLVAAAPVMSAVVIVALGLVLVARAVPTIV